MIPNKQLNSSIWPIDWTLTGTTTPGQRHFYSFSTHNNHKGGTNFNHLTTFINLILVQIEFDIKSVFVAAIKNEVDRHMDSLYLNEKQKWRK